ncbi:dUTP diphosphatase [Staphylococcus saprophyticus]|uniref:dUTP diphosphatase n=1 Tax=Staphylococcus saprophyticus TaxID=29385 RepID=UPI0012ADC006|nr:dUTP diphosphatase [Staphylococcus saprophyticus]MDW4153350.1 dUTP diphosphatase [Staphylococcus saprophyticus]MDW4184299.1 dUTP diphosphatase [Staphylococcus saprophyticus]MDW4352529.1 dUTP diphosphatase [Staphylococcus saprophyticus]MDW4460798.1 dUTP diphosphatase [Staphylococcus saprophyticus]MDW4468298.1 dUTP diphosphatase [Staphylococcus saprophyticus]
MKKLIFKRTHKEAITPYRANPTDSGLDIFTCEAKVLEPGETAIIDTGIAIHLDEGYEAQVRTRSGVTAKTKLRVQLGTIDNSYHKSIGIIVDNIGKRPISVDKGKKLAQLVVQRVALPEITEVESFERESERSGFGSTGY